MKMHALIAGSMLLAFGMVPAQAGPCTSEIDTVAKLLATKDAGSGPTSGATAPRSTSSAAETPQHPPTSRLSKETEGKAASPEDVRRQTAGQPTVGEASQGARGTTSGDKSAASAAVERARALDVQGKEVQCMEAAKQAKSLLQTN
jgi:hypothetical protein